MAFTLGGFSCDLEEGLLTAHPGEYFSSVLAAIQTITPHLSAWEVWSQTANGVVLDVDFVSADRGSSTEVPRMGSCIILRAGRARHKDPRLQPPPVRLGGASEAITNAARRWREVLENRETTAAGAYGVFTVLEWMYNGRDGVATKLQVSPSLLSQLGRLTATATRRSDGR